MTANVETIIRGAVALDPTITPKMLDLALSVLRGEPIAPAPAQGGEIDSSKLPDIIPYKDAMRILHIRRSQLFEMLRTGRLKRVYGNGSQGIGITRRSFVKVIDGRIAHGRTIK